MVGSDISELLRLPARARFTRSESELINSSKLSLSTAWIAGAINPPCRSEIATPTCTASLGWWRSSR